MMLLWVTYGVGAALSNYCGPSRGTLMPAYFFLYFCGFAPIKSCKCSSSQRFYSDPLLQHGVSCLITIAIIELFLSMGKMATFVGIYRTMWVCNCSLPSEINRISALTLYCIFWTINCFFVNNKYKYQ